MATTPDRIVRVALLGFGTVGTGAYRMLENNREAITKKAGLAIKVARIGIRDADKTRSISRDLFSTDLEAIVDDPSIDVVLELIGGVSPAGELVERALRNGKHVVTANKELIAKNGSRLVHMAKDRGLDLHYEAAVGGGIPLVQPLKHQLAGNDLLRLMGILNGTTNYILSEMADSGAEFGAALTAAQDKGYAEADPSSDVDGFDAQYKLAVLASIAFGKQVPVEGVFREGIRGVTKRDMHYAELLGYRIKLLGIVEPAGIDRVFARVHPALVRKDHPLASVSGVYNAVWFQGDFVGDVMFSGRGAGSDPTASAVVGDLIDVVRNIKSEGSGSAIPYDVGMSTVPVSELRTPFYVRTIVEDRPKVLGALAAVFGEYDVSLAAMEMRVVDPDKSLGEIVFLTHVCVEANFRKALQDIESDRLVREICSSIRVVE